MDRLRSPGARIAARWRNRPPPHGRVQLLRPVPERAAPRQQSGFLANRVAHDISCGYYGAHRRKGPLMRTVRHAAISLALLLLSHSADAHGIAGNRFFVGTLTFDDPSVRLS
jgi:hypothetical protein